MCFRLVPKSVTLNDLERRNGPYFAPIYKCTLSCNQSTDGAAELLEICHETLQIVLLLLLLSINL